MTTSSDGGSAHRRRWRRATASSPPKSTSAAASRDDLRQASGQAHQASQAKTMFLANMSHEIRPAERGDRLHLVILLEDRTLATPAQQRLQTILQAGQRVAAADQRCSTSRRSRAGGPQPHPATFDLRQEIDEIARLFAERAEKARLGLLLDRHRPGCARAGAGDRSRSGQIVMNLLGNAVVSPSRAASGSTCAAKALRCRSA